MDSKDHKQVLGADWEAQEPVFLTADFEPGQFRSFLDQEEVYRSVTLDDFGSAEAETTNNSWAGKGLDLHEMHWPGYNPNPVPAVPEFIEPSSSMLSQDPFVLQNICKALSDLGVEHRLKEHKHQIKAVSGDVKLRVNLFCAESGDYVVEVQRRSGDILAFSSLLRRVKACLDNSQKNLSCSFGGSLVDEFSALSLSLPPLESAAPAVC